uniref:glycosyltransferase family 4 protein n=1 Tax=Sphingomonas bacterium TaxID=1895847 RepID=UPI00261814CD|nr:glycosyltransferase family 4 protein [Sphingomonas bacterium]
MHEKIGRRIVFVNRFYAPDHSATAQILTDLAEHLAGRGWDVEIVTSRLIYGAARATLPARDSINGVAVTRVPTIGAAIPGLPGRLLAYMTFYFGAGWALLRRLRRGTIVVAKTDPPLIGLVALVAARLRGAKLVNWVQDLYPEIAAEMGMRVLRGPIGATLSALRDLSLRRAALTVAIGRRMADRIARHGVSERRIAIIANWSDDEAIAPSAANSPALREEWGLPDDAFVLEYSGNLGRAHEADTLLAAAALLAERRDIWFLFVGGGHAQAELRRKAAEDRRDRFVFQPYQPRARLSESLAVGDAHWLSLRPEFEGLIVPSKVFGIAAAARPIVAVCDPNGEVPSMIAELEAGIAVTPGDGHALAAAILSLADDRAACRAMGGRARVMLQQGFLRDTALEQWTTRLETLVEHD